MNSNANTVEEYLASLPDDRREAITTVRNIIVKNLPKGYEEVMNWGMITYEIPLERKPDTYNKKPLMYAALASQKNHMAVYLTAVYATDEDASQFREDYIATGKKLDMGKSCVRFKKLEDLPLELIGKTIASTPVDDMIDIYETLYGKKK
jgi:uncharacterized protein YdhG (YjbR/CyaY superfamily)